MALKEHEGNHVECWCGKQLATLWLLFEHRRTEHGVPYAPVAPRALQRAG